MKRAIEILFILIFLAGSGNSFAEDISKEVGVQQKLGATIPANAVFLDSHGNKVRLGDLINKPTVIDFAYYKCTGICTPLMTEIADVVDRVDLIPGKDYNILTISFNPDETPKDAASKKFQITNLLKNNIPLSGWKFLTGDSADIKMVTQAAGFNFERQGDGYMHTGVLIFVSPDRKICRYLKPDFNYRGDFKILPFDFKMALLEASKGEQIPVVDQVMRYCFRYQPKNKTYVLDVFKISGIATILVVTLVFVFIVRKPKKKKEQIS